MLDHISRLSLGSFPTPFHEAPMLAKHLNISKLFIKRDDETGLAFGGNKVRKLEYDFADIINNNYDTVVTVGGVQSNHARLTAAAARKMGIDIKLVLGGVDFEAHKGNLLLDVLFGAEIRYILDDDTDASLNKKMLEWIEELKSEGRNPISLPIGGSTPLGALGYVNAIKELSHQFGKGEAQIVLPVGSCGTFAGVVLGCRLFMPDAKVFGISISRNTKDITQRTMELIEGSSKLLKITNPVSLQNINSVDNYFDEYGKATKEGIDAIKLCARLEGILLDPIYTGKAMAGLIDLVQNGSLNKNVPIIFIHTGGLPILFDFNESFEDYARITKY